MCVRTHLQLWSATGQTLRLTLSKLPSIQESCGSGHLVVGEHPGTYETSQLRKALYSCEHPDSKTWASWWVSAEATGHDRLVPWCKKNRLFPVPWEICSALWTGHHLPVTCSVIPTRCSKNISHLIWQMSEAMLVASEKLSSDTPKTGLQSKRDYKRIPHMA